MSITAASLTRRRKATRIHIHDPARQTPSHLQVDPNSARSVTIVCFCFCSFGIRCPRFSFPSSDILLSASTSYCASSNSHTRKDSIEDAITHPTGIPLPVVAVSFLFPRELLACSNLSRSRCLVCALMHAMMHAVMRRQRHPPEIAVKRCQGA